MSNPTAERLRILVSDYYHGLVTFDSYREQRGQLLDALGTPPRAEAKPAAVTKPVAPERSETRPRIVPPPPPAAVPQPAPRSAPRFGVIAAGLALVAAIGAVAYLQLGPANDTQDTAAPLDAASLSPGEALLERFIERNAWDRDAAGTLAVAWNSALSEPDRALAIASPSYRRFSDALRRRLREEEALAGGNTNSELETLLTLAAGLGVRYTTTTTSTPAPARSAAESPATGIDAGATTNAGAAPASIVDVQPEPPAAEPEPQPAGEAAVANSAPASAGEATRAPSTPTAAPSPNGVPAANTAATAAATEPTAATAARTSTCSAQLLNTRRPFCNDALGSGGNGPALAIIAAGSFSMGDEQTANATPVHSVTISQPFAISIYEVSFAEFRAYCTRSNQRCPDNPWSDDAYPAVLVSWTEATSYAQWLSMETGQRYRLPSEAEWEYAARAGSTSPYPFGDNVTPAAARSSANGAVSSPLPSSDRSVNGNTFRLWHMIGNVREWVADGWYPDYANAPANGSAHPDGAATSRTVRGGSYSDGMLPLRSAARLGLAPSTQDATTGFRVVRELAP
jgi:formylglycine-generating enzyme required for sulfatase activity